MKTTILIVLLFVSFGFSLLWLFRYDLVPVQRRGPAAYRLDRWTGEVWGIGGSRTVRVTAWEPDTPDPEPVEPHVLSLEEAEEVLFPQEDSP